MEAAQGAKSLAPSRRQNTDKRNIGLRYSTLLASGHRLWKCIFQRYGFMAMRTEQHGNLFAKLNNRNLGGICAVAR
jgi:hypothetical protein